MARYRICFNCNECEGWHTTAFLVEFPSLEFDGRPVSVAYAGRTLSSNIKVMQEPNKLHCSNMNRPTSQPDLKKIFLAIASELG